MHNLIEMLKETALKFPGKIALVYGGKSISYRNLVADIVRQSLRLEKFNIGKGDRIGILLANSSDFVISYFAILNRQAVAVPLNHFLKPEELENILKDCELRFLITRQEFSKSAGLLKKNIPSLEDYLFVDSNLSIAAPGLKAKLRDYGFSLLETRAKSSDTAVILYTSGTTGRPKGAMLSHGNLISDLSACVKGIEVSSKDSFLCMLPLFHSFPSTVCMLLPIAKGAKMVIVEGVRPFSKILKAIMFYRVTVFVSIPAVYNILVNIRVPKFIFWPFLRKVLFPLRICISGAAALSKETLKKFEDRFGVALLEGYGLTETSPVVSFNPYRRKRVPGSVGLPLDGIDVKVVDENNLEVKRGVVGELIIKGANVMQGYFGKPEETREVLKDGWFHSGDLARIDDEGFIYIVDRKKDMINIRGLKIYPREVEEVLCKHPAVKEAVVLGVKDEHHGEIPKAFVVLKGSIRVNEHELLKYLRMHIASYKVPRNIEFKDDLPKSSTGKILKHSLTKNSLN